MKQKELNLWRERHNDYIQFFNTGGKKKKISAAKQRRKAKRMAERFAKLPPE